MADHGTFSDLIYQRLKDNPSQPLITAYDDATGERVELSGTTYANWVAKTANLFLEELDLEQGDRIRIDLPAHWLGAVFLGAAWTAGLSVSDGDAELVVGGPELVGAAPRRSDLAGLLAAADGGPVRRDPARARARLRADVARTAGHLPGHRAGDARHRGMGGRRSHPARVAEVRPGDRPGSRRTAAHRRGAPGGAGRPRVPVRARRGRLDRAEHQHPGRAVARSPRERTGHRRAARLNRRAFP